MFDVTLRPLNLDYCTCQFNSFSVYLFGRRFLKGSKTMFLWIYLALVVYGHCSLNFGRLSVFSANISLRLHNLNSLLLVACYDVENGLRHSSLVEKIIRQWKSFCLISRYILATLQLYAGYLRLESGLSSFFFVSVYIWLLSVSFH